MLIDDASVGGMTEVGSLDDHRQARRALLFWPDGAILLDAARRLHMLGHRRIDDASRARPRAE